MTSHAPGLPVAVHEAAPRTPDPRAWRVVADRHRARDAAVRRLLAASDLAALIVALALVLLVAQSRPNQFLWGLVALPAWVIVFKCYGLYDRDIKRISHTSLDDVPWIFHAMVVGGVLLFFGYRLTPVGSIDVGALALFAVLAMVLMVAFRSLGRRASVRILGPERVLMVGGSSQVGILGHKMRAHPEYGALPVGVISRAGAHYQGALPVLGDVETLDLEHVVARHRVERVVVSHEDLHHGALMDLLRRCRVLGVKVSVIPQMFDALGPSVELDDVEGITVLGVNPPVLLRSSRFLKRSMDLIGAGLLLAVTAPVLVAIAVAIKLESGGPVLFRQRRVGKGGEDFELFKFRTMLPDAEAQMEQLLVQSRDPDWLLLDHDPRVTRVGRLLRLSSLDELPQLWNVLRGDMSLVGPRPIVASEDRRLDGWRRSRVDLTPGLTGLWQVLGRTSIPFEEMIKLDYIYVTNWSLWTDVRLILRTLPAVIQRRGAN